MCTITPLYSPPYSIKPLSLSFYSHVLVVVSSRIIKEKSIDRTTELPWAPVRCKNCKLLQDRRENKTFENDLTLKPTFYFRYAVDDCFLIVESHSQLERLIEVFRSNLALKFTSNKSLKNTFHCLDVDTVQ